MHHINRFLGEAVLFVMMLTLISVQALAQKQGRGNNALGTTLIFDYVASVNGKIPTWSGDFTMAAPTPLFGAMITNLSFSIRGKDLNLPDNSRLFINLCTNDIATGTQSDTDASR